MSNTMVPFATGPALLVWQNKVLGYAEDRIMFRVQPFWDMVHADSFGGLLGPPADRQLLGAVVQIMAVITTSEGYWTDLDATHNFTNPTTLAVTNGEIYLPAVGSFARVDGLAGELLIYARNEMIVFDPATLTEAHEFNSSARHRKFQLGWTAEIDDACERWLMTITGAADPCSISSS